MKELKTELEINASPSEVWKLLSDFEQWPTWNPIVNKVIGKASFRWRAKMIAKVLFTNDKIITLKESANGTQLSHVEAFSGLLVPLFWGKLEQGVIPMLTKMNKALQEKVEAK